MNSLLFADYMRRQKRALLLAGSVIALAWFFVLAIPFTTAAAAFAVSLLTVDMLGPMLAASSIAPLEVRLLPVSQRQIHRTLWWVAVLVPTAVLATGKVMGWALASVAGSAKVGLASVWLSSAFDLLFAGMLVWFVPMFRAADRSLVEWNVLKRMTLGLGVLMLIAAPLLPFGLGQRMPTRWADLTWAWTVSMAVAAMLTAAAYFVTPRRSAWMRPGATRPQPASRIARRWPRFDGVTGPWRMVLMVWLQALMMQVGILAMLVLIGRLVEAITSDGQSTWVSGIREMDLLLFTADYDPKNGKSLFLLGAICVPWRGAYYLTGLGSSLRHLRTMPLSVGRILFLLLALPLAPWATVWLLLAGLHLVTGTPMASLRIAEFVALVGADCFFKAHLLRRPSLFILMFFAPFLASTVMWLGPPGLLVAVGVAGMLFGAAINRRTLTTDRNAYVPMMMRGFGIVRP